MPHATLHDGTLVDTSSEEWRHECEARAILDMPRLSDRRAFLYGGVLRGKQFKGVRAVRGEAAVQRLEKTMMALFNQRRRQNANSGT
ncbi:hypothetical protein CPT_Mano_051 [Achromobacter phage Mano]|uniref:Uncharacterized protein n=1 Tax=Achromobacter phage Mano TaxID=2767570 RepID=A0A7L8G6C2_9CAUD|nr:hypothetical protein KB680_gp40 [Achromobacter phage Mano]QOE32783.1 hypothetical protein CPT_Mano_051 [Achromobacter phage Mano]